MQEQEGSKKQFWCHSCRLQFMADFKPGEDVIVCPKCHQDFCELNVKENSTTNFVPFQKAIKPKIRPTPRFNSALLTMRINQLSQIIQSDFESFQVTPQMISHLRHKIEQRTECAVCKEEIEINQEGIIPQCRHVFHEDCLGEWIKIKNSCPLCRKRIINIQ